MSASATVPRSWTRRRKFAVLGTVIVCAVVVGLLIPTLVGGSAPVLHWTCQSGSAVLTETVQVPGLFLNSPYGGRAWGNVTYPVGFLPGDLVGEGTQATDGGAAWAGFESNLTVFAVHNETAWGPGSNDRCSQQFEVALTPIGNPSVGIPILGPGNRSDQQEPTAPFPGYSDTISFSNGFQSVNSANVSTCGGPIQSMQVASIYLTLWAHFATGGQNHTAQFNVPLVESAFHYWFPANFGTWQVDNLSAPGGPGGGWAFSYSPCS